MGFSIIIPKDFNCSILHCKDLRGFLEIYRGLSGLTEDLKGFSCATKIVVHFIFSIWL